MATVDRSRHKNMIDEETERQIVEMIRDGKSNMAISRTLEVSEGTVRRTRKRWGLAPVREGRPVVTDSPMSGKSGVRVPNKPLSDAIDASDVLFTEVCRALGFVQRRSATGKITGDTARFKRSLGRAPSNWRDGKQYQQTVPIELAERVCEVIGVDFDEVYPEIAEQVSEMVCKGCGAEMRKKHPKKLCGLCQEEAAGRLTDYELLLRETEGWAA
jgi:hypothetical protein